jgi:hypothetical protein
MECPNIFLAKVMELKLIEFNIIEYVIMVDAKKIQKSIVTRFFHKC